MAEPLNLTRIDTPPSEEEDPTAMIMTMLYMTMSGFVMSAIYLIVNYMQDQFWRRFTSSISFSNNDDLFKQVLKFLRENKYLES